MKTNIVSLRRAVALCSLASVAALSLPAVVRADTMVLQNYTNGYTSAVSGIGGHTGTSAAWNGTDTFFRLGDSTASGYNVTDLFQFNDQASNSLGIGYIPEGNVITSATLTLTMAQPSGASSGTLFAAPITGTWTSAATSGTDTPLPTIDTGAATSASWSTALAKLDTLSFDVTGIVQSWLNGSTTNNGIAIYAQSGSNSFLTSVYNSLRTNPGYAPLLTIEYAAIPEPATAACFIGFVSLVVFAIRRRRRRLV